MTYYVLIFALTKSSMPFRGAEYLIRYSTQIIFPPANENHIFILALEAWAREILIKNCIYYTLLFAATLCLILLLKTFFSSQKEIKALKNTIDMWLEMCIKGYWRKRRYFTENNILTPNEAECYLCVGYNNKCLKCPFSMFTDAYGALVPCEYNRGPYGLWEASNLRDRSKYALDIVYLIRDFLLRKYKINYRPKDIVAAKEYVETINKRAVEKK